MALLIRRPKTRTSESGIVRVVYPAINKKIVNDITNDGLLDKELNKEILDIYLEFGDKCFREGEVFRIPYVGSFKPKPKRKNATTVTE